MRKIKSLSPEYRTDVDTFDQGKTRQFSIMFDGRFFYIRAAGLRWKKISYGSIYLHAAGVEAGFDPSPAKSLRRRTIPPA